MTSSAREMIEDAAEVGIDSVHDMDVTLRGYAEGAAEAILAALPDIIKASIAPLEFGDERTWCEQPAWYADTDFGVYCIVDHSKHGNDFSIDGPGIELGGLRSKQDAIDELQHKHVCPILSTLSLDTKGAAHLHEYTRTDAITPAQAAKVLLGCDQDVRKAAWKAVRDASPDFGRWFAAALRAIAEQEDKT